MYYTLLLIFIIVCISYISNNIFVTCNIHNNNNNNNIKHTNINEYNEHNGNKIDTHKVLEGITEPFDINLNQNKVEIPPWKVLKNAADMKTKQHFNQQALKEYGYILRTPHLYNEIPSYEKYNIFLTMAKLLKYMGFHQRAEVLLIESLNFAHTPVTPFESHFQLGKCR